MIYRSLRVGKNGKLFHLYKLRTMNSDGGTPTASMNDPRLTTIGKWLRRFKLDEIPTLWNLIKGDIAIVGPRPDTVEEIESLDEETRSFVLKVRPGIISPATLWNYKEDEVLSSKENPHEYYTQNIKPIKYYLNLYYVINRNTWYDIRIIIAYVLRYIKIKPKHLKIYPKEFNDIQ